MTTPPLPEQIELHRDRMWRRDEDLRVRLPLARLFDTIAALERCEQRVREADDGIKPGA